MRYGVRLVTVAILRFMFSRLVRSCIAFQRRLFASEHCGVIRTAAKDCRQLHKSQVPPAVNSGSPTASNCIPPNRPTPRLQY